MRKSTITTKITPRIHNIYGKLSSQIRNYELEVPKDVQQISTTPVIYAINHSNIHDFYTIQEVFEKMINVLVASDSLNILTRSLFKMGGSILIDRRDKQSCQEGINRLISKLSTGNDVVILPEATWNIHPSKPMLPMKLGVIKVASLSGCPIIPVIFEYIEKDGFFKKEEDTIEKCIVKFGHPIYVTPNDNQIQKIEELRDEMATMRWEIWEKQGIYNRIAISPLVFKNHDELKINTPLFKYDYELEEDYIYGSDNYIYCDYPINRVIFDENGQQVKKRIKSR